MVPSVQDAEEKKPRQGAINNLEDRRTLNMKSALGELNIP
jgi:hypothetical protein